MGHGFPAFLVPLFEMLWPLVCVWCAFVGLLETMGIA